MAQRLRLTHFLIGLFMDLEAERLVTTRQFVDPKETAMGYKLRRNYYSLLYIRICNYLYLLLSYRLQKYNIIGSQYAFVFLNKIEKLNQRRIELVEKISKIKTNYNLCIDCNVLCCRGNYNHFFSTDYLMRIGSKNPLSDFNLIDKPHSPIYLISNHLNKFIIKDDKSIIWMQQRALSGERCPNWIEQMGCSLSIDQKPLRCLIYTCPDYRNSFSDQNIKALAKLMGQLIWVVYKTYNLYRQTTKEVSGRNAQ